MCKNKKTIALFIFFAEELDKHVAYSTQSKNILRKSFVLIVRLPWSPVQIFFFTIDNKYNK